MHQERGYAAYTLRLIGEIAAHRSPPEVEQAEASHQQALTLTEELGIRLLLARCGLGILYTQTGRLEQARAETALAQVKG